MRTSQDQNWQIFEVLFESETVDGFTILGHPKSRFSTKHSFHFPAEKFIFPS
jgi:hypothetical protein